MNGKYSKLIRISETDFCLITKYVIKNYIEKYPVNENEKIPIHEIIKFLIMENLGIYYNKLKCECENEHNRNKY